MTTKTKLLLSLLPTFLAASASARSAAAPPARLEIWQRDTGGPQKEPRRDVRSIDLDALPLVEVRLMDVQYGGQFVYRGVRVQTLIERYDPPRAVDLALLHFANGMQIPLAFRESALVERLDLFVARQMRPSPGEPFVTGQFPRIDRARAGFVDVRPIEFGANKLVVGRREHPAVPEATQGIFSPWMYVDSLVGIELVSSAAYYAQFDVDPDPGVRAGLALYEQSCQFCHGARKVGAAFGWDFVEPVAVYSYRGARNLFYHVKYKPLDATAKGLMMPALSHLSEQDATSVWQWLRAIATRPMPPYVQVPPAAR
jgi:mono/diheme cytochrome c family protein